MERRYILVHTHPENLVIGQLSARQFAALPLTIGVPIESRLYSLQPDLFTDPDLQAALADPDIEVVCLCLRASDRYGEAARLGMTVVEVTDINDAYLRAQDRLPSVEEREIPADEFGPAHKSTWTIYKTRQEVG